MTMITTRHRARAAALVGGVALLTGTIAGVAGAATAAPAVPRDIGPEQTLIMCGAPGTPALPEGAIPGPRIHLEHFEGEPATTLPTLPGDGGHFAQTVPALPGGDVQFAPAVPLTPGDLPALPTEGAECVRISPDGQRAPVTVPADGPVVVRPTAPR